MSLSPETTPDTDGAIHAIERPAPKLLVYYTVVCALFLPVLPVAVILWVVNYFRYHTMRYRFDTEGISMRWGILFRREILLNYARIQDIHLVSNMVERHLGLARIQIQTASGSATPEMTLEGLHEFEAVRDFLYARMRGTREPAPKPAPSAMPPLPSTASGSPDELAGILREIAAEVRSIREQITQGGSR